MDMPEVSPPWGAFPAEQYLLHHWNPEFPESGQDQRLRLIKDSVHVLDEIPEEWVLESPTPETMAIAPSPAQVRDILAPWRPLRWRSAAWEIWNKIRDGDSFYSGTNIWLRTHYAEDEERKAQHSSKLVRWFEEYVDDNPNAEEGDKDTIAWRVLDDESVFNFGDDWTRVFEVIPELAGPMEGLSKRLVFEECSKTILADLFKDLREKVASLPSLHDKIAAVESSDSFVQHCMVDSFLLVADEMTCTADELLVLFLDKKGNYIRQSRISLPYPELFLFGLNIELSKLGSTTGWSEKDPPGSTLNPKYGVFGEIGRELYGVDDLLQQ